MIHFLNQVYDKYSKNILMMVRVSTKPTEFIIKSHTSTNKARTLAQLVERAYELTGSQQQYKTIPTIEKEKDYVSTGFWIKKCESSDGELGEG